jgi:soluble lytic murein transglycosylase-like protein
VNAGAGLPGRRRLLGSAASLSAAWIGAPLLAALPARAHAGGQVEEPLADSVRSVLSSAIANQAPPKPVFASIEERLAHLRWLGAMSERLTRQKSELVTRVEFLQTLWYETRRAGIDVSVMLGLVQVESAFRKYAISVVGARGYTQVMPFWARLIGDGDVPRLFHMQTNLRFGCVILRHYLDREAGNLFLALGRYNGSRGRAEYPNAVFAAQQRWAWADPAAPTAVRPTPERPEPAAALPTGTSRS